jgi:hypothetical protein
MIIILAIDALEYEKVEEFGCNNLKQESYGKTDISEFSQPRTMVLWSSFMTGKNKEKEILAKGDEAMWSTKIELKHAFFSHFKNPVILDLPGFSYDQKVHEQSRQLLKKFFAEENEESKEKIRKQYNQNAFEHHNKIKKEFLAAIGQKHELVLGYFSIADVIGHLNFSNRIMMKMIYKELDEIASLIRQKGKVLVLSDHGMKQLGRFGDHSDYGFWSTNFEASLKKPKITDFYELILKLSKD